MFEYTSDLVDGHLCTLMENIDLCGTASQLPSPSFLGRVASHS